jgi:hypothetical protein
MCKDECICGNDQFLFECICDFVKNNPGDKDYTCMWCGIYTAGSPRCNECDEYQEVI